MGIFSRTIVLVCADRVLGALLAGHLARFGHRGTRLFETGAAAAALLDRGHGALVLFDESAGAPDAALVSAARAAGAPIVLLTGGAMAAGADMALLKPLVPSRFQAVIADLLGAPAEGVLPAPPLSADLRPAPSTR